MFFLFSLFLQNSNNMGTLAITQPEDQSCSCSRKTQNVGGEKKERARIKPLHVGLPAPVPARSAGSVYYHFRNYISSGSTHCFAVPNLTPAAAPASLVSSAAGKVRRQDYCGVFCSQQSDCFPMTAFKIMPQGRQVIIRAHPDIL